VTNYRDQRTDDDDILPEADARGARLISDLSDLYLAPVPDLRFEERPVRSASRGWLARLLGLGWRPALVAAAAATILAAVLVAPPLWNGESRVSAEVIFARTSAAAQRNAPAVATAGYHLVATIESPSQPGSVTTTETWYADPSHLRTEQNWSGGGETADFGLAVSGDDAWLYGTFDGVVRVAHGPAPELGATFGQQSAASDIGQVLSQYTANCQTARQDGEETVAGRTAYKIVVTPDVRTCPATGGEPQKDIGKLGTLNVWVDKETFLPLKTEQLASEGGPPGYIYTVTSIEVGGDIAASTFEYVAPEGVAVQDVANLTEAKNVLSGFPPEGPQQ
jgi:outer membrane lipoprotein-sorting protein